jgi:hypothetical protein
MAILAFSLAGLCVVGAVILTVTNHAVPQNLWTLSYAALVGGAGIAVPASGTPTLSLTEK